jgi:hypothetical protein
MEEERGAGMEEEWGADVMEEERGTGVVEEERGTGVEVHVEDMEEGARWRADVKEGTWWRADTEEERAPGGVGK